MPVCALGSKRESRIEPDASVHNAYDGDLFPHGASFITTSLRQQLPVYPGWIEVLQSVLGWRSWNTMPYNKRGSVTTDVGCSCSCPARFAGTVGPVSSSFWVAVQDPSCTDVALIEPIHLNARVLLRTLHVRVQKRFENWTLARSICPCARFQCRWTIFLVWQNIPIHRGSQIAGWVDIVDRKSVHHAVAPCLQVL